MNGRIETERILDAFLASDHDRLPDRVIDAALADIARTPQRRALRVPWRFTHMPALSRASSIAAIALVAVVGVGGALYLLGGKGSTGFGGPTQAPTPPPTQAPTPAPTAPPMTEGVLKPGTYAYRPLPAPDDSVTVTFTVPSGWEAFGASLIPAGEPTTGAPGGMAIQFIDITTINGDPCRWSGQDDDITVGPTVDDLVQALLAQTAYEVADPVDVTIGGFSGKRVDIVAPTEPFPVLQNSSAPQCDEGVFRLWSTSAHGPINIYIQGPANRWQANILDVDGTRLVIVAQDFPGTLPADRAEMDAIIASLVIQH
jgi:hypothetical protein